MSNTSFKDVRNLKKNSITMAFINLDPGKEKDKENLKREETVDKPLVNREGYLGEHKIKDFDHKLEQHKTEILKNNTVISDLSDGLKLVREELLKQTEKAEAEEKKNKLLKQENEKTNRVLRFRQQKLDEAGKKLEALEKEVADSKSSADRNAQLNKQLATLQKKISQLERSLGDSEADKRNIVNDRDYQIQQLKNSLSLLQNKYGESEELKTHVVKKEEEISSLRTQQSLLSQQVEKERRASLQLMHNNASLQEKLKSLLDETKSKETLIEELGCLKTQNHQLKKKSAELQQTKTHLLRTEQFLRKKSLEYEQLSLKYAHSYEQSSEETRKLEDALHDKTQQSKHLQHQIDGLTQQTHSLTNQLEQASKASKQLVLIKDKGSKLHTLYKQLLPPLKCTLCTKEFDKPVTVIPCGHNYCLNCKRGYNKSCVTCGPGLKIEAVYRNELLDDIVKVVKDIKQILVLIN